MIVLDEQLLGRSLEVTIAKWYRGSVCFITDLRPQTVIKDEAIPRLLQQQKGCTFVSINEIDFWRKVAINQQFCIVCFALTDTRVGEIPSRLRTLLHHPLFSTKRKRMGKVIRVSDQKTSYYAFDNPQVISL